MLKTDKSCVNVYLRKGRLILNPLSQTNAGIWISTTLTSVEELNTDKKKIGQAILEALQQGGKVIEHPKEWNTLFNPILMAAGVRSYNQFMAGTKCVRIELEHEEVKMHPSCNKGPKGGFEDLGKVHTSNLGPENIGTAILDTFTLCLDDS